MSTYTSDQYYDLHDSNTSLLCNNDIATTHEVIPGVLMMLKNDDFDTAIEIDGVDADAVAALQDIQFDAQNLDDDFNCADELLKTVENLLKTVDPVMEDVSAIKVGPLPVLSEVGKALDVVNEAITTTVEPAVGRTKKVTGKFRELVGGGSNNPKRHSQRR